MTSGQEVTSRPKSKSTRFGRGRRWKFCLAAVSLSVAALMFAAPAGANHGVNVFSGKWNTAVAGTGSGYVNFSVVDNTTGAQGAQDYGGTPCTAPTTYYTADYSDGTNVGRIWACTRSQTRLVGRYRAPAGRGGIDITFNASSSTFSGTTSSDDFGTTYSYTGTFVSHLAADGCCPAGPPAPAPAAPAPTCALPGARTSQVPGTPGATPACKTDEDRKRWTRLSIEHNELAAEYCTVAAVATGLALVPGAQILAGAPAAAAAVLCAIAWKSSAAYARWANDPPDPNFKAVAAPQRIALPRIKAAQRISARAASALNRLARNLANQASLTEALRHAYERAQGAAQAGDAGWAATQRAAAARYADTLRVLLRERRTLAGRARSALKASRFPTIRMTSAAVRRIQRRVRTRGFPSTVKRIQSLVLTASERAGLRAAVLRRSAATVGAFPGLLTSSALAARETNAANAFYIFASKLVTTTNTFSGTWTTTWSTGGGTTMTLTQSGSTVTGTYTHDGGRIQGTVSGRVLTGTWDEAPTRQPRADAGEIIFVLGRDGRRFSGLWRYGSSGGFRNWSGTCVAGDCLNNKAP
jgi:hypothetical protein